MQWCTEILLGFIVEEVVIRPRWRWGQALAPVEGPVSASNGDFGFPK